MTSVVSGELDLGIWRSIGSNRALPRRNSCAAGVLSVVWNREVKDAKLRDGWEVEA